MLVLGVVLNGCAASHRYELVEQTIVSGDVQRAPQIIEQAEREYGSEGRVLYDIDLGMTLHIAGQYQASNAALEQAEDEVERLHTTCDSRNEGLFHQ